MSLPSASTLHLKPSIPAILAVAVATIAVGIEPLIKGSFTGAAFAIGSLAFLVLLFQNWRFGLGFAALLGLSLVGAWILVGQPLQALPHFFIAQAPIVSGYTEAMSIGRDLKPPFAYLCVSAVIILNAYYRFVKEPVLRWVIVAGLAWTLFIGFKAGFVRQDYPHIFIATGVLLLLGYLVCTITTRRAALAVGIAVIVQWFIIGSDLRTPSAAKDSAARSASLAIEHIQQTFQRTVDGLFTRATRSEALQQNYTRSIEAIKAQHPLPHVAGTVDIYPYQLAAIFGNNLRWSGRPVFLSFNSYTSELQEKNVAHLTGSTAPDTVFFTFAPLDHHLPTLEDSQSLLKLLSAYQITALATPYVQMDRAPGSINAQLLDAEQRSMVVGWDQDIPVTDAAAVWVNVNVRPTLLGRLVLSAFKLPELEIELTLADGSIVRDRFISSFGRAGFIVSPYLSTAADLVYLTAGISSAPRVQSFKLVPYLPEHMPTPFRALFQFVEQHLWKSDIGVRFTPIKISPQPTARALVVAQPPHQTTQ